MGAAKRTGRRVAVRVRAAGPFRSAPITTTTSGWNDDERTLTSANVNLVSFGQTLAFNIPLNDQVDAQPLVLGKVKVTAGPNPGDHRVGLPKTTPSTWSMP
jgi:hypothetical protein